MSTHTRQPNVELADKLSWHSLRFWSTLIAVGAGAGLAGRVLMRLLHSVEHRAWQYRAGDLLRGIDQTTPTHRVAMLLFAGVIVAITGPMINRFLGKPGNINAAIWFRSARIPAVATLAQSVQSIVIVRLRTSLGREASIKQAGGIISQGSRPAGLGYPMRSHACWSPADL